MNIWKKTFTKIYPGVSKEIVWQILTDINHWPKWHGDLDDCKLEGTFAVGNYFMLKPKGMRPVKIVLTDIQEGCSFTDCTTFFGARMYDTHAMEITTEGLRITNTLMVTGPLKWLWVKLVAQHVADTIEEETEALISLARKQS
ncbi:MAG: SRPBCC family protein [Chthoniobacterales bacterium]|nr:SRPBCC family protein [Chthoniobacterales bacterium]